MRIQCYTEEYDLENDYGNFVPGVKVTCNSCHHITETFGTGEGSIKRCLALMREECPNSQKNYYVQGPPN